MVADIDDARRWANRGLQLEPMNVKLALLLDRIGVAPDQSQAFDLTAALRRAATAHPDYPDVQRALIFNYQRLGRLEDARRHARSWLDRAADHPLARRTYSELAA
jgi:lipopolysaccharide biosynthesis regulator YciM